MNTPLLLTALATGLAGSAHCVAMCGGISASLGLGSQHKHHLLTYHAGRLLSYTALGLVFGCLLPLLSVRPHNPAWGMVLRLAAATVMLLTGLQIAFGVNLLRRLEHYGARLWRPLASLVQSLLPVRSSSDALLLGILWGLLPCGLIYNALGLALVSGNPLLAALTMLTFGLGTLPAMLLIGAFTGTLLKALTQDSSRLILGGLIIASAIWTALPFLH